MYVGKVTGFGGAKGPGAGAETRGKLATKNCQRTPQTPPTTHQHLVQPDGAQRTLDDVGNGHTRRDILGPDVLACGASAKQGKGRGDENAESHEPPPRPTPATRGRPCPNILHGKQAKSVLKLINRRQLAKHAGRHGGHPPEVRSPSSARADMSRFPITPPTRKYIFNCVELQEADTCIEPSRQQGGGTSPNVCSLVDVWACDSRQARRSAVCRLEQVSLAVAGKDSKEHWSLG